MGPVFLNDSKSAFYVKTKGGESRRVTNFGAQMKKVMQEQIVDPSNPQDISFQNRGYIIEVKRFSDEVTG